MSDASTSLADHPAGKAKTLRPTRRRGLDQKPGQGRWQSMLWDSTPPSVLLEEAGRLIERRSWRKAVKILAVAATTSVGDDRRRALQQLAVASADGGQHQVSCEAVFELQELQPRDADTWVSFANVALARGNYSHADAAARSALAEDPNHRGAWLALSAGYAGLGWFDQAGDCLTKVDDRPLTHLEQWRIGRAVNRWSLARSRWLLVGAVSALLVGVLAFAIATSIPFLTREWRLRGLRSSETADRFESFAGEAWRFEKKLRFAHAATVVASVAGFVAAVTLL